MTNDTPIILQVTETTSTRIDVWLSQALPDLSRSRIQNLISQGQVKVNDQICLSKKVNLKQGDRLELNIPLAKPLDVSANSNINLDVLYEDEQFLILNKPVGLVVHPAPGHSDDTLVNALLAHCENLSGIGGVQRPGIVHRLDKDTSGAIAIAKTDLAYQSLQSQIQAKTAQREYLGIVYGHPKTDKGKIDFPIGRHPVDRKKMAILPIERGGRNAVTHWQIEERLGNYSLILFRLETGRTHQIRVHSAKIGHPIVGDPLYSSGKNIGVNLTGQALHAWRLTLQHPVTGAIIRAIAPIPGEFETLLNILRNRQVNSHK
jgi:23S rRNA pseudouridine1911/1915/1917 synthase